MEDNRMKDNRIEDNRIEEIKEKEATQTAKTDKKEARKELWRTVKFVLCSVSAGLIQLGSFSLLTWLLPGWAYMVRYLISLVLSVLWNFTLNRRFTFQSANNVPVAMLKVAAFYAVFTPVTMLGGEYLVSQCGWNDFLVEILTMALNFVTEYIYDRFVVFGASIDTNEAARKKQAAEEATRGLEE